MVSASAQLTIPCGLVFDKNVTVNTCNVLRNPSCVNFFTTNLTPYHVSRTLEAPDGADTVIFSDVTGCGVLKKTTITNLVSAGLGGACPAVGGIYCGSGTTGCGDTTITLGGDMYFVPGAFDIFGLDCADLGLTPCVITMGAANGSSTDSPFGRSGCQLVFPAGTQALPSSSFACDLNTGRWHGGDGIMNFGSNNALIVQIANAGVSVQKPMSVVGTITIVGSNNLVFTTGGMSIDGHTEPSSTRLAIYPDHSGRHSLWAESPTTLVLAADNTVVDLVDTIQLLNSDSATASDRTFTLDIAAMTLFIPYKIKWESTFAGELLDTGVYHLKADWRPDTNDIIQLWTDGTSVFEDWRTTNRN